MNDQKEEYEHQPVLLAEVLDLLITDPGGLYLDATLGLGGHAEAILRAISAQSKLMGLDQDPEALARANARLESFAGKFRSVKANFRTLGQILEREKFFPLAGALFDIGVSSLQLDKADRGFSFQKEGPLDMRMDPENPLTAEAVVNRWPEEQIALLIKEYGEDPNARKIANMICKRRETQPFKTTTELASAVLEILPRRGKISPSTKLFQALRIAVNAELESLTRGIESVLPYMQNGGRICVITFHSLEDRIVKNLFASFVARGICRTIGKAGGVVTPSEAEVESNARARSAKLRVVEKL